MYDEEELRYALVMTLVQRDCDINNIPRIVDWLVKYITTGKSEEGTDAGNQ